MIKSKAKSVSAHPRTIYRTCEFFGIVQVMLAVLLKRFMMYPDILSQSLSFSRTTRSCLGSIIAIVGIGMVRSVHHELHKYYQPHEPGKPTTKIVTSGIFSISRHPTYLACVVCFAPALSLFTNNLWFALLIPLQIIALDIFMIQPEEEYLFKKFPNEYGQYCKHTKKWLSLKNVRIRKE